MVCIQFVKGVFLFLKHKQIDILIVPFFPGLFVYYGSFKCVHESHQCVRIDFSPRYMYKVETLQIMTYQNYTDS